MRRDKKFSIGLLPAFLCILAMFLSACGNSTSTPSATKAPDSQQVFHYPTEVISDFGTLDPALAGSTADTYAIQMVFTGLVQFDNNGNLKDQLAQSHEVSSDGLTYTFHLRPNLKFSDGTSLTAHDVEYSINRALLPDTHSQGAATYLNLVKSMIVRDNNTISIIITHPAAYFLDTLSYPTSYVVEQSLITKYGTSWTDHLTDNGGSGGDGPFKVKKYDHGKTFNVVPNPNYYGPQPALKEIDMSFSGDSETTYKAYKNHQYDWASVPGPDLQEAQKRSDFYKGARLAIAYTALNFLAKPFNNLNIRKAFALAINKEILANDSAQGAGTATNHIVPQGMYGYNANLKGPDDTTNLTGNQTLAQHLLAQGMQEEGYSTTDSLPTLTLTSFTGNSTFENVVNEVVNEWKTVLKVNVKANLIDFNTFDQETKATSGNDSLQMWTYGWQADYTDPQDWLTVFFGKGQSHNTFNYGDNRNAQAKQEQDVQAELDKADIELDTAKRLSLYNDAEQKLVNDVAWLPLYQASNPVVQNPKLHGYKTNPLNITDPDSWNDVYITV